MSVFMVEYHSHGDLQTLKRLAGTRLNRYQVIIQQMIGCSDPNELMNYFMWTHSFPQISPINNEVGTHKVSSLSRTRVFML